MRETVQTLQTDEEATLVSGGEEATLVAPRFDDEETLVARPVVPLGEAADAGPPASASTRGAARTRRPFAPRRSWLFALVIASVLVGGMLGGAGLYLYQRQSQADGAPATPLAETQAETQQPPPAPATEPESAPRPDAAAQPETPAPEARTAEPAADETQTDATPVRAPENVSAAERRAAPEADRNTLKRGKKGERDGEIERRATPRPGGLVARDDDTGAREARRVDSIVYRPRRAARRERARPDTAGDADRLRRIFDGTPQE